MKGYFQNSSGFVQLCLLIAVSFGCLCFALFIGEVYVRLFSYNLRSILVIQNSLPICLTALIMEYLISGQPLVKAFALDHFKVRFILLGILILVVSLPLMEAVSQWNQSLHLPSQWERLEQWMRKNEDQVTQFTNQLLEVSTWKGFLINIFQIAILTGICEELLFRGVLQKIFIRWTGNIHLGIWITALVFSAVHIQFFGFFPRTLIGALLGYLFVWTGSLWVPVLVHTANNLLAVVFTPTEFNKDWPFVHAIDKAENPAWLVIVSLFLACIGLFVLYRMCKPHFG